VSFFRYISLRRPLFKSSAKRVLAWNVVFGFNQNAPVQHFTAKVERGEINDVVEVIGTTNAAITVRVGSQVSGTIAKLNTDFNSRVHKGDVVALIDPALFNGALLRAAADLENADANLLATRANLEKAEPALVRGETISSSMV
jgi:HlyD family secretion protein